MLEYGSPETVTAVSVSEMSRMWWMHHPIGHPAQFAVEPMIEGAAAGVLEEKHRIPTTSHGTMASITPLPAVETFNTITAWSESMWLCHFQLGTDTYDNCTFPERALCAQRAACVIRTAIAYFNHIISNPMHLRPVSVSDVHVVVVVRLRLRLRGEAIGQRPSTQQRAGAFLQMQTLDQCSLR